MPTGRRISRIKGKKWQSDAEGFDPTLFEHLDGLKLPIRCRLGTTPAAKQTIIAFVQSTRAARIAFPIVPQSEQVQKRVL
jgi:hypothetical protein